MRKEEHGNVQVICSKLRVVQRGVCVQQVDTLRYKNNIKPLSQVIRMIRA